MAKWECKFLDPRESPPTVGTELIRPLTVGDLVGLSCSGEAVELKQDQIQLSIASEKTNYTLRIVNTKVLTPTSAELDITSYAVGDHGTESFVLSDGTNFVELGSLRFSVVSVIQDPKQEPYGAFGPWKMSWPLWYWAVVLAVVLSLAWFTFALLKRIRREMELRKEIAEYRKRHSPFDEYQRESRLITKKLEQSPVVSRDLIQALDQQVRLFLLREFVIRFPELKDRRALKVLKRRFPASFEAVEKDLTTYFVEIARARQTLPSPDEFRVLLKIANRVSDMIFQHQEKNPT